MPVVGRAEVLVSPSFSGFQQAAEKQSRGAGTAIAATIGKGLLGAAAGIGVAAGGLIAKSLQKGFGRLTSIEDATAKLRGLGHSAGQVKSIMNDALASVKGTAFGLDEAATVAATAVAAGVKPGKDLQRTLKLVADAATIGGTSMQDMGDIFNKVATSNKVQGDTIQQLNQRGIPIVQLLAKTMGKTTDQVVKLSSQGKIGFDQFRKAMQAGMGGAALKSGETTTGALKNVGAALSRFGAGLLGGLFPHLSKGFTNLIGFLDKATAAVGPFADKYGNKLGKVFEHLTKWLAGLNLSNWHGFLKSLHVGGQDVGRFSGIVEKVRPTLKSFKSAFAGGMSSIGKIAQQLGPQLKQIASDLPSLASGAGHGIVNFFTQLAPAFQQVAQVAPQLANGLGKLVAGALGFLADHMDTIVKYLPVIIGAMLAWHAATKISAASQFRLAAAQTAMIPVTTANNILRLIAIRQERRLAAAKLEGIAATEAETGAESTSLWTRLRIVAVQAVQRAKTLAVAAAQKVAAAGQWLLNAAMEANPIGLVVLALAALVAGFIIAYKKSETFRKIVNAAWDGIKKGALAVVHWFTGKFVPFFTKTIPGVFHSVLSWVKQHWPLLVGLLINPVATVAAYFIHKYRKQILGFFSGIWQWVSGTFRSDWSKLTGILSTPIELGRKAIHRVLGGLKTYFRDMLDGYKRIWSGLTNVISGPVKNALGWLGNHFLAPIKGLLRGVGLGSLAAKLPTFAAGGTVPGWSPNDRADNIPAMLTAREFVTRQKSADKMRRNHPGALEYINRYGELPKYGIGGWVGGLWGSVKHAAGSILGALNPAELFRKLAEKLLSGAPGGMWGQVGLKVAGHAVSGLVDKVKDLFSSMLGGGGSYTGGGASQWTGTVRRVLSMLGVLSSSNVGAVLRRIQFESGGNPRAINLTDINAQRGDPSRGLMQTIMSTFLAYAGPFRRLGIYNPLANIFAGVNYALHRYGSIAAIDPRNRPYGYGLGGNVKPIRPLVFDQGGILPPGLHLTYNGTGRDEYVRKGRDPGPLVEIGQIVAHDDRAVARGIETKLGDALALAGVGWAGVP